MNSLDCEGSAPREQPIRAGETPTWLDWFAAHGWWTALIAGGLLCAIAVVLS